MFPELATWQAEHADRFTLVVISAGEHELNLAQAEVTGISTMLLQTDREIAEAYRVRATPAAVVVGSGGSIASTPRYGVQAVRDLVHETLANAGREVVLGA